MATAILPPPDCLDRHRGSILPPPLKPRRNSKPRTSNSSSANPNFNRNDQICSSGRRRRIPTDNREVKVRDTSTAAISPKNLVMGQVKILKRGEILSSGKRLESSKVEDSDLVLGSTDRLGPDPDLVQKQVVFPEIKVSDGIYAGSGAFFASPPPSLVPLPSFLDKNGVATSDLRRLLRLDLN